MEDWDFVGERDLQGWKGGVVSMTCQHFAYGVDQHCHMVVGCNLRQRQRYWQRLSGPLLDRLDLQLRLERRSAKEMAAVLKQPSPTQASASWCNPAQIERARQRMKRRKPGGASNGRVSAAALRQSGAIEATALELWEQLINQRGLSTRSSLQLLRVARTIADLKYRTSVDRNALAEASCFRCTDLLKQPGAQ